MPLAYLSQNTLLEYHDLITTPHYMRYILTPQAKKRGQRKAFLTTEHKNSGNYSHAESLRTQRKIKIYLQEKYPSFAQGYGGHSGKIEIFTD
ncbi:hypothetical protein BVX94_00710, partial [bacterium B17]